MRKGLVFIVIVVLIYVCGGSSVFVESNGSIDVKVVVVVAKLDGEKIYKQYCVICYGFYGDMGVSGVYNLQEFELMLEECINVIINGCKVMIVFEVLLDEKEIKVVVKYIMKFG